jgi:hypothetical protein
VKDYESALQFTQNRFQGGRLEHFCASQDEISLFFQASRGEPADASQ